MRLVGVGNHYRWINYLVEHRAKLSPITVKSLLGCGQFGCVFDIGKGRVLKVTLEVDEAATWDVIASEQRKNGLEMRGVATAYERPFGIRMPSVRSKLLYGVIREGLGNVRQSDRLYDCLKPISPPKYAGDTRPLLELEEMVRCVPAAQYMAASIQHLYKITGGIYFLADIHTDNVGRRNREKWLVLRDPGYAETPTHGAEFGYWQPAYTITI